MAQRFAASGPRARLGMRILAFRPMMLMQSARLTGPVIAAATAVRQPSELGQLVLSAARACHAYRLARKARMCRFLRSQSLCRRGENACAARPSRADTSPCKPSINRQSSEPRSMPKDTFRIVTRGTDGTLHIRDYNKQESLLKSHTQIGVDDCSTDLGLRGLPVLRGLIGPMPEGKNVIRYESPEVFETLTKEWGISKSPRRAKTQPPSSMSPL